ncbi:hypothetical protein LPJ59_005008 [Coemansia sp. RSA 2399]|nr:hypothetical protein LPJ59_005008 [Coemansia sp. RSA 2399]
MPTTIHLSAQDALFSLSNHPLVHFFENKTRDVDFMPTARLWDSLKCALKSFPILIGHIQETGRAVVVDESNPNLPDFVETSSSLHYGKLKEHQFNWNVWPSTIATVGPVTAPGHKGVIKLLSVHAVRLSDNSGLILFCNIPHYVLDGVGYYEFLGHWAMLCRERGKQPASHIPSPEPATSYVFDRSLLSRTLYAQRRSLDSKTVMFLTRKSCVSTIFAKLPYKLQTRLASTALRFNHANAHYFHVSSAALEGLYRLYCSKVTSVIDFNADSLASYAMLTALFSTAIIQAFVEKRNRRNFICRMLDSALGYVSRTSSSALTILNCVHAHKFLDIKYIGNPVFIQPVIAPLGGEKRDGAPSIFADVAEHIYTRVGSIDALLLGELYNTLQANPNTYANLAMSVAMGQPLLTFIDEREYRTEDVDFGCGSPSWVSALSWNMPNFIAFQACPQGLDGAIIYASLKDDILEYMFGNAFFTKYARLLF